MSPVLIIFHVSFLLILFIFLMPIWVIINVIRDADLYDSFIEIDEEYAEKVKRNASLAEILTRYVIRINY